MPSTHAQFDRMTNRTGHRAHVIPFAAMTPAQQTDHLMTAHGFDHEGWGHGLTDEEVRDSFLIMAPADRALFHAEDGDGDDLLAFRHRHDKAT